MTVRNDAHIIAASDLIDTLALNISVLGRQTSGLTHADSLLQPAPRGNCLNWIAGHLALHREYMLQDLSLEPEVGEGALLRYARESMPIAEDGPDVVPFSNLLDILARQQDRLADALASASPEDLGTAAPLNAEKSVAGHLQFLCWHEAYHVGATELLRQLAGTDDKVI
jgi:hypothetical protein